MANNLTTTSSGYALDARQGVALNNSITALHTNTDYDLSGDMKIFGTKCGNVCTIFIDGFNFSSSGF